MSVNLLAGIDNRNNNNLPNWSRIQRLIPTSNLTEPQLKVAQAHESTFFKIRFSDYHISILEQIYRPDMTDSKEDTKNWARAEMHSIVFNLYSALDSLGYEINLAYQFGIDPSKIHIYHNPKKPVKNCLRCKIDKQKDSVTSSLNNSLNQHWFEIFHKLRNQITHKDLPVLQISKSVGGNAGGDTFKLKIPNDPTNSNPRDDKGDYSDNLELKQYCVNTRTDVLKTIEGVYPLIEHKIPQIL
jgi:hypothetical protein